MSAPTRNLLILFAVLTISAAIVIVGSASPPEKLSSAAPTQAQEKLPDKDFTHPPEKPHEPADLYFKFDQLDHFYRVPGEFTHRLTGDQYGFEALSFIITETHPHGGPGLSCA